MAKWLSFFLRKRTHNDRDLTEALEQRERPDADYCSRLVTVFNTMASNTDLGQPGGLLAQLPTWMKRSDITVQYLLSSPRVQATLAEITSYTPGKWLLEKELSVRISNDAGSTNKKAWSLHPDPAAQEDVFVSADREKLAGLALSGGGIRSATFALGVLQSLAAHGSLAKFDYLSSVSGGGYIHQWLASWIYRDPGKLTSVNKKLIPQPDGLARAPQQISWLRRYSSYLTPRSGLFTADTWTMICTWLRNTSLNQIILFSFLAFVILIARTLVHPFTVVWSRSPFTYWQWLSPALVVLAVAWSLYGCVKLGRALRSQTAKAEAGKPIPGAMDDPEVVGVLVAPAFLLSVLLALNATHRLALGCYGAALYWGWVAFVAGLMAAVLFGGQAFRESKHEAHRKFPWNILKSKGRYIGFPIAALFCVTVAAAIAHQLSSPTLYRGESVHALATELSEKINTHLPVDKPTPLPPPVKENRPPQSLAQLSCAQAAAEKAAADKAEAKAESESAKAAAEAAKKAAAEKTAATKPTAAAAAQPCPTVPTPAPAAAATKPDPAKAMHPVKPEDIEAVALPLAFFFILFISLRLIAGLIGDAMEESRREWLARLGAWSFLVGLWWLLLTAIGLWAPILYYYVFDSTVTGRITASGVIAALHAVTLWAGGSGKSSGKPDPDSFFGYKPVDLVGIVGAPLVILSLLIIVAGLVDVAVNSVDLHMRAFIQTSTADPHSWTAHLCACTLTFLEVSGPFLLSLGILATCLLFGWRVDVNDFSMLPFYRNRLARAYLGATDTGRTPDPFTGFDGHSATNESTAGRSIPVAALLPTRFGGPNPKARKDLALLQGEKQEVPAYDGPFPIISSTISLTFGEDLAYQERKAASFAFTPMYSGYHVGWTGDTETDSSTSFNGFVPTVDYAYPDVGIHLHTAAAISGAAVSPNRGYSSQPPLAFLMTLFNVRLSWWIANPRRRNLWKSGEGSATPGFGLFYLLRELFGSADDTSNYVCLSDGGNFENMGLYELVRRRCAFIVVSDAESDPEYAFEGIGRAIEKCRTDFGVEIDLKLEPLRPDAANKGYSHAHFAKGTIRYPAPPGEDPGKPTKRGTGKYEGVIFYLKTTIVGDEPGDILHHRLEQSAFPNDSTMNQWFNESQFESYRRLGQWVGEKAIAKFPEERKQA